MPLAPLDRSPGDTLRGDLAPGGQYPPDRLEGHVSCMGKSNKTAPDAHSFLTERLSSLESLPPVKEYLRHTTLALLFVFGGLFILAGEALGQERGQFGPFRALLINREVVEGVFAREGRIHVLLSSEAMRRHIVVKASDAKGSQYRVWAGGRTEQVLGKGPSPGGLHDSANWVETSARYVEYWFDGELILHLERVRHVPTRPKPREVAALGERGSLESAPEVRPIVGKPQEETPPPSTEGAGDRFGVYRALIMNRAIVTDVKVDDELNTYIKLNPDYRMKEIRVKISNSDKGAYREWHSGGFELVSPANAGRPPYGWTDWIQVRAKYVEYWMDGELFLHLMRTDM